MKQNEQENLLKNEVIKAQEESKGKSRFFSYISHDMRTPVNGILGMTDIALQNLDDKEKLEECLSKIQNSSNYLLSLVNNVIDMAKIENGKFECVNNSFDMREVIGECVNIFEGLLAGRKLKFTKRYSNLLITNVCGDALRLKQILVNLFGNSVKFTPDGGEVSFKVEEVRFDSKNITYRFIISDTGVGMSEDFKKRIFEPFEQEENDNSSKYMGSGLGMAITKQFVELMDGDIKVESEKGVGSSFSVTLTFDIDYSKIKKEKRELPADFKGKNLLIVDDSDLNVEIMQEILKQRGADTIGVLDGKSAIDVFEHSEINSFDAILMDVTMPIMNGIEATKIIRSLDREDAKTIPIFAMTGNIFKEDVNACKEAGMNEHLAKPINLSELRVVLSKYKND